MTTSNCVEGYYYIMEKFLIDTKWMLGLVELEFKQQEENIKKFDNSTQKGHPSE